MNNREYRTRTDVREMLLWLDQQGKLDRRTAVLFACRCAARTLHLWRKKHPEDKRPRDAIRTALRWWAGRATEAECRAATSAASAASYAAYAANAASSVDYAAGYGANASYYAAYAASYAANGAYVAYAYAANASAASAASYAASASASAGYAAEQQWQSNLLRKMVDPRHALERLAEAGRLASPGAVPGSAKYNTVES